jgi:hypothetical protein
MIGAAPAQPETSAPISYNHRRSASAKRTRYHGQMTRDSEPSGKGANEKSESQEFDSRFPRTWTHPYIGKIRRYPRLSKSSTEELLAVLGQNWDADRYGHEFARYRLMKAVAAPIFFSTIGIFVVLHGKFLPTQDLSVSKKLLLAFVETLIIRAVWLSRVGASKRRFFRAIGAALRTLEMGTEQNLNTTARWLRFGPLYEGSLVEALNFTGIAARALFSALQRSRRTWQAPPTVAERAMRLSSPLVDIEIVDDLDITYPGVDPTKWVLLHAFLYDVAAVVAIHREDLIPAVRALYSTLPSREENADNSKTRDRRYLDPMHERSRWEIVKDYVLPLSSWLSLSVSIVALIIASKK